MNATVDIAGTLERAGADADAPEGSQAWALAQVGAAVAELIEACRERDSAQTAWASSDERQRQEPGPLYQRSREADARYAAALARFGGAK
ncbi:hypothetical protein [Pseudoxanthomonas sp. SE1]|uniref:hypothetical protein n=1 Tax=Pseudoxanthomonas sp. SE1 TaxID=1664560 RepID=UPI00240DD44C|nr:hypothetical protein [Pseudoxanthomonas sp. SE1]WFC43230.1 hypothetical protein OY559_06890 [Pseudoxanthomonas sp. SE1]